METAPTLIYKNTVQSLFVKRLNRFVATVLIDGTEHQVHIKNTGRLSQLLVPNARVTLQKADASQRKTQYDLISVYRPQFRWINVDSLASNELVKQDLAGRFDLVKPEYVYGNSRIDFYMERGSQRFLREVKGCTLAIDQASGTGYFPDAPTERGIKHLNELAQASKAGYICSIAFVIQMNGIHCVLPNDAEFRTALTNAVNAGVQVVDYTCQVEADSIRITAETEDTARFR